MRILSLALCMAWVWVQPAHAQTIASTDEVRALTQRAMERVVAGNVDELFDMLSPYWPIPENEITGLRLQTLKQRNLVRQRFGANDGIARVDERLVADSILRITYIEKFERHIIRWVFTFYKPEDRWVVNGVNWDDDIDALFQ